MHYATRLVVIDWRSKEVRSPGACRNYVLYKSIIWIQERHIQPSLAAHDEASQTNNSNLTALFLLKCNYALVMCPRDKKVTLLVARWAAALRPAQLARSPNYQSTPSRPNSHLRANCVTNYEPIILHAAREENKTQRGLNLSPRAQWQQLILMCAVLWAKAVYINESHQMIYWLPICVWRGD